MFNSVFEELKEAKYLNEVAAFKDSWNKTFEELRRI